MSKSSSGSVISGKNQTIRRTHGENSSVDSYSSESDNDLLRKNLKIDDSILYCEPCDFKTGTSFKSNYNTFGITQNSIVFFGSFAVRKKRKIVPFKNICGVEWLEDDSVRVVLPLEKGKFKYYNIKFKTSHKGSPFRLIESRWQAYNHDPTRRLSSGEELYRNPSTQNLLRHFQSIPRDERLELSYRCRIKGSLEQNYGVMFVTYTRILFLSIDTTYKTEEIRFEKILDICESLPSRGKIKKSILITVGKDQVYSFSSFESKEESFEQIKYSWETFKKMEQHHQMQQVLQQQQFLAPLSSSQVILNCAPSSSQTYTQSIPTTIGSNNPLGVSQSIHNLTVPSSSSSNKPQLQQSQQSTAMSSSSSTYGSNNSLSSSNDTDLQQQQSSPNNSPQHQQQQQPSPPLSPSSPTPIVNYHEETYNFNNKYSSTFTPGGATQVYKKINVETYSERANKIFSKEPESANPIKKKFMKFKSRGCCVFFY